jgi:hypothetical protein
MAMPGLARADSIAVLNSSFESPDVSASPYYAMAIDDWGRGNGSEGTILNNNVYGDNLAGCDGSQMAFVPVYNPGWGSGLIYQDLAATFEAGKTYTLTAAFALFSHEPDAPGSTLEMRLHYRIEEDPNQAPAAATTTVLWDDLSKTEFRDFSASITVNAGDSMVGRPMGISMWGGGNGPGADFAVDNVRLTVTSVPEPSVVALALSGMIGLLAYAWRKRV